MRTLAMGSTADPDDAAIEFAELMSSSVGLWNACPLICGAGGVHLLFQWLDTQLHPARDN